MLLAGRNVEPRPRKLAPLVARLALVVIGLVLGAYDGFFGPGTGSLLVVAFTTVFGDNLTRASGNAKVVNFASNLAAFMLFAARGTSRLANLGADGGGQRDRLRGGRPPGGAQRRSARARRGPRRRAGRGGQAGRSDLARG